MHVRTWFVVVGWVGLCGASAPPAWPANSVEGTSEVEVTNDLGFEGLYKYTLHLTWNLEHVGFEKARFYVRLGELTEDCESGTILFADPAGTTAGMNGGEVCEAVYSGSYLCKDLPWFPWQDQVSAVAFEQEEASCHVDQTGSATFFFYSSLPPEAAGLHRFRVGMRRGWHVAVGSIQGSLPGLAGEREDGIVLINEFIVKPKPGDSEFLEVFSTQGEPIDLAGWYVEVNGETRIPLGGEIGGGGFRVSTTAVPENTVIADFDLDPYGVPIGGGVAINDQYAASGITFTGLPATSNNETCSGGSGVFANPFWSYSDAFGSAPNVVSVCPGEFGAAFSEFYDGTVQVDLCAPANRVCINVMPEDADDYGFIRVEALGDSVQGEVVSPPGVPQTICFEFPSITRFYFAGFGPHRAAFDNLQVTFVSPPECELAEGGPLRTQSTFATAQDEEMGFVPDAGATLVLFDNFQEVQDSVAYGNQGGAPISPPIVFPPGYPIPPVFQRGQPFGTLAATQAEPDTFSTSTQRVGQGQDTGSSANDFNIGKPSPEASNTGGAPRSDVGIQSRRDSLAPQADGVETPALGSSMRINSVYAFGLGTDGLEFFNPTSNMVDMAGWFLSDGSIVEPIYDAGGPTPVPTGERAVLPQGYPATFSFELDYEDVLYLYDPNLVRLDQMGWTQVPFSFPDLCLVRLPDGAGPADGYDFNTSGGSSGNLLYLDCTLRSGTIVGVEGGRFTTTLAAPYPNPASEAGTISFVVGGSGEERSTVHLAIYDVAGRKLSTLADGELPAGPYAIRWNGRREDGIAVGSGVYFVRLRVGPAEPLTRSLVWGAR